MDALNSNGRRKALVVATATFLGVLVLSPALAYLVASALAWPSWAYLVAAVPGGVAAVLLGERVYWYFLS